MYVLRTYLRPLAGLVHPHSQTQDPATIIVQLNTIIVQLNTIICSIIIVKGKLGFCF